MGRRKSIVVFPSSKSWLRGALGYQQREVLFDNFLEGFDIGVDFDAVEKRAGVKFSREVANRLKGDCECFLSWCAGRFLERDSEDFAEMFGIAPRGEAEGTTFGRLIERIQRRSKELEKLIDELVELEPALALRPNGGTNIQEDSQRAARISSLADDRAYFEPGEVDFIDYYGFRKSLDYFSNFEALNSRFNNTFGNRYTIEHEYPLQDRFIRFLFVSLSSEGVPTGVAVPTDTNPDYESPIVGAIQSVLEQMSERYRNSEAVEMHLAAVSNRQLGYKLLQIREDIERNFAIFARV